MHFNNSVIAANFIKKILERRDKKNIQVLHQPSDKKSLHVNLIEKDGFPSNRAKVKLMVICSAVFAFWCIFHNSKKSHLT